jgi:hypothetical protein
MIRYYIYLKGIHVHTFLSPVQIMKGDFVKVEHDSHEEHDYIVEKKHIHVTHQDTTVILNCK